MEQTKSISKIVPTTFSKIKKLDWKSYFIPNKKMFLLIPYVVIAALFIVTPMVMLIVKASTPGDGFSQSDITSILKLPTTGQYIWQSVWLGVVAAFISLLLAFPFAYIVSRSRSKVFKLISIVLIISPLFVFTVAKVFAMKILLIKMYDDPLAVNNHTTMIVGMVYLYMPFMIVPLYSVLNQMPQSLLEASKDLGYSRLSTIFKVVFPYSLKAIFSGLAIVFMLSATSLVISGSLVGSGGTPSKPALTMIGTMIDQKAAGMRTDHLAAAQGSLLAIITIVVMSAVYCGVYLLPILIRKIRGGVNA